LDEPKKWAFEQDACRHHVEDEAVKDLFEYDKSVVYDPKAQYVGRMERLEEKDTVELEMLP